MPNQVIQLRMQHGLTAAQRDDANTKISQGVRAVDQHVDRNRRRDMIVLVAVRTCDVATPGRNHVRQDRMVGINQRFDNHAGFAQAAM